MAQPSRSVGFFGGEPLLAANRPVVEYIIEKTMKLGSGNFWAISNATELEAYQDLLGPGKISTIQITLDGPPTEHDKRRIYPDGAGSFEKIAKNISMALDCGAGISLRMNVDRTNLEQLPELANIFHERGWAKNKKFAAYTAPVSHIDKSISLDSWQLSQALTVMEKQYPSVSIIDKPSDRIKVKARKLFRDPENVIPAMKESFCGAHTGEYLFDCFADMYACWEQTGDPSIKIGHIDKDGNLNMSMPVLNKWRDRTVATGPVCSKCRYALYCGGGCAVLAEGRTGNFNMNYCDGFGSNFRAAIAQAYVEHLSGVRKEVENTPSCER